MPRRRWLVEKRLHQPCPASFIFRSHKRSAVVLKDVLGHSLAEIAALLDLSVDAVKAALSRGRTKLHQVNAAVAEKPAFAGPPSEEVTRFVALFNHATGMVYDAAVSRRRPSLSDGSR